jgi:hypothetical protein
VPVKLREKYDAVESLNLLFFGIFILIPPVFILTPSESRRKDLKPYPIRSFATLRMTGIGSAPHTS